MFLDGSVQQGETFVWILFNVPVNNYGHAES